MGMNEARQPPQAWPYRSDPPQRYSGNYKQYLALGGQVDLETDIKGFTRYYESNFGDLARFYQFCLVYDQICKENIAGDMIELGVYRGNTAYLLARFARRLNRAAYFLDTYQGFDERDLNGPDTASTSQFADTSLEAVTALVGEANCHFIKGYFPGTATELPADACYCLVHIDCDLYAPAKSALEYFYPRTSPGGFLIVHDYSSLAWKGVERAVDEFFADKSESPVPMPDGAGSAVIRKARVGTYRSNWRFKRQCAALTSNWVSAGQNRLVDLLVEGWSGPEPWGVWGVGSRHRLEFAFQHWPGVEVVVEVDVSASLLGSRQSQNVNVTIGDRLYATWHFVRDANRSIRSLRIPASAISRNEYPTVVIEFRPQSVVPTNQLDSGRTDDRPLGLALHAIRRRH